MPNPPSLPKPKEKQVTRHLADHLLDETQDKIIIQMLSPHAKIDLQVKKGFEGLEDQYITLVLVDAGKYQDTVEALLRKFSAEKTPGVYITINKPAKTLLKNWSRRNIPAENVHIIDGSSHMTGISTEPLENVDYLDSLGDLTELIIAVEKKLRAHKKNVFLILDSITTLLVYNEANAVERFVHSLMGKIEEVDGKGVLIMLESDKFKEIIQTLSQFCDRVIELV